MRSSERWPPLDLDALRTTAADVEALRRRPARPPASFEAYLRFLAGFGDAEPVVLRARPGPRGGAKFAL